MICLMRVDDRLIHGQVQTNWIQISGAKNIMVIDDKVKNDEIACQILRFAVPGNMKLKIMSIDEAVAFWPKAQASANNIMVLFKSICTCSKLQERGISFDRILMGPVSCKPHTTEIVNGTYFTDEEIKAAHALSQQGVEICFQQTPDVKKEYWHKMNV